MHLRHHSLANLPTGVSRDVKPAVLSARLLPYRVVVDSQSETDIAIVRELRTGGKANLSSSIDGTTADIKVVAVLYEDGVISVVCKIDALDDDSTRLRDTKDATPTAARDYPLDVDVGVVVAIELASLVCKAKGSIPITSRNILAIDEIDPGVGNFLEEESAFTHIAGNNLVDGEAIDIPGLDAVAGWSIARNDIHSNVVIGSIVAVEANAQACAEVEVNSAESKAAGSVEKKAKVGVSSHGEVRNLDVLSIDGLDGAASAPVADIDGTATLEDLSALDDDGVGTDGPGSDNCNLLTAANGVYRSLDSSTVVTTLVDVAPSIRGNIVAARSSDLRLRAITALCVDGTSECEKCSEESKFGHLDWKVLKIGAAERVIMSSEGV